MPLHSKDYNETVDYLYGLRKHGIKLGLKNSERFMGLLGEPQKSFHSIHIAGTNGKGSTAAITASILRESGFRVGLFTSPHLVSFTERMRINGSPISEEDVIELAGSIRKIIAETDLNPTFFEFVTAMAFYFFAREKVEWAVVEVGMGGRFDATNVISPLASVITNIGFDHKEFLGESISEIAFEKAGIIKPKVPVVTAVDNPDALKVIENYAHNAGSELHLYGRDFKSHLSFMNDKYITFDYTSLNPPGENFKTYGHLSLPLTGKHQIYNASLSIRVCEILRQEGFPVSDEAVRSGIAKVTLSGRFEWISYDPPVIIDSAHNPDAATAIAGAVKEVFPKQKNIILIAGIMKDKDIEGILAPLVQVSDTIIVTRPKGERAAPPEKLKEVLERLNKKGDNYLSRSVIVAGTVEEALERAKEVCGKNDVILVTGSFYTTGEAKEILGHPGVLSHLRE